MKREYDEGPEAAERFEKMATTLFRAPKSNVKLAPKPVPERKIPARASVCACLALAVFSKEVARL